MGFRALIGFVYRVYWVSNDAKYGVGGTFKGVNRGCRGIYRGS